MQGFERVTVYGVSFDAASKQPIVLLKAEGRNLFLPIWIGHPEAAAILMKLQNADLPRPMTHDLLANVIGHLQASVTSVLVTELRDNTFYAVLTLDAGGQEIPVDSRPSDAIALAVRTDAPIFVSEGCSTPTESSSTKRWTTSRRSSRSSRTFSTKYHPRISPNRGGDARPDLAPQDWSYSDPSWSPNAAASRLATCRTRL